MTEIRFYHLQRARLEDVLPTMLERAYGRGQRALVALGSGERVEAMAAHLWTYRPDSFLPHGTPKDGEPAAQPIFLTDSADNPNGAQLLFLCDGALRDDLSPFELVCELFDGNDETVVTAARQRWRDYKAAGHTLIYYQQTETGRWEEKARG
ncbi:MAG TPA: DNA polymerase III subunit chi [Terriglobales bacterium]|nr:DNA polymerase III subunit chi [Terriglobales bacterium]